MNFDVAIIGMGMAGSFAAYRLAKEHSNIKVLGIDTGRPPLKRRLQCWGFLGLLPNSDGKLYLNDLDTVSSLIGAKNTNSNMKAFTSIFDNICNLKTIKDRSPSVSLEKKFKKHGFNIQLNNHIQIYPKDIHYLSKFIASEMEVAKNLSLSFDNEVISVSKQKGMFVIQSERGEFKSKKLLLCVGRAGWRWVSDLYDNFGLIKDNNTAKFGVRIEMPSSNLKEFNRSNLILRNDHLEIGPFCWGGTVIPEDHIDLAISSFRSNENRWKSDKVSFQFISHIPFDNKGYQQTDRIGKLTFILTNDRIAKERVSTLLNGKSVVSIIPEYKKVADDVRSFGEIMPEILTKAYFHVPTILPLSPRIEIGKNLETEIDGLFVAGESAGIMGLLAAGVMGLTAAKEICK